MEGHIAEIGGVPTRRRLRAILSGNFTPPRDVRAQFDTLVLSAGLHYVQGIQGYLEGVDADFNAHLALDSEGATRARSPKTRFIFPVIASAVAGLSLHQDYNSQGIPDQDIAGRAESGAVGLGLIGTLLAQTSRTLASTIAFTGAGFSVYSNFIARGEDVVLPVNTPVIVSLRTRGGGAAASTSAAPRGRETK